MLLYIQLMKSTIAVSGYFQASLREMHNKQALCNKNLGKQTILWHRLYWKDNEWFLNHPRADGVGSDHGCVREGHKPLWSTWMILSYKPSGLFFGKWSNSLHVDLHVEDRTRDLLMLDKDPTTELYPRPTDHVLKKVKRLHWLQNSSNEKEIYYQKRQETVLTLC